MNSFKLKNVLYLFDIRFRTSNIKNLFKGIDWMSEQNVTAKGLDYLNLALWAFAGLGVEVIYAFLLEPFLYRQANG